MPPKLQIPRIIWGSLLMSSLSLLGVAKLLLVEVAPQPEASLLWILVAVALADAVASFVIPAANYRRLAAKVKLEVVTESVSTDIPAGFYRDAGSTRRVPADLDAARSLAYRLFLTPFILGLAFAESIAFLGVVVRAVGFPVSFAAPFMLVAALLIALRFPTEARIFKLLETAHDVDLGGSSGARPASFG